MCCITTLVNSWTWFKLYPLAPLIIANQKHIVLSRVQTMHCTQGSFVYRLKILHNHTASHKVLILSIKYSQDRIRGVFPSVLGVLSKVHSHGLSYFWRNPEPHDGSWPGAPGTRWFVWIVDVGRESSLPSPVFLFLLWEGGREGGKAAPTPSHISALAHTARYQHQPAHYDCRTFHHSYWGGEFYQRLEAI